MKREPVFKEFRCKPRTSNGLAIHTRSPGLKNRGTSFSATLLTRFWSYVHKSNGCWLWTGGCFNGFSSKEGFQYGEFHLHGNPVRAHRLSWEIHFGSIPKGLYVLHRCDNPSCVRPDHLWLGTGKQNYDDMVSKGRRVLSAEIRNQGEENRFHKLTNDQVLEIRKSGMSSRKLAIAFNVGRSTVRHILARRTWAHL